VVALAVTIAPAQDRRKGSAPPPRFASPQPQRQGPPPTLQRGDARGQQAPSQQQPDQQQRPFDRFILHGQGPHSGDWLRQHENLPPEEQKKALQADPQFQKLPKDRQQQLMDRLTRFSALPHEQRDRMLQRMETLEHLSPDQRDKAREMFRSFRDLPQDRRQEMNRAFRDLEQMSPEDRQKTIDSDEYRRNYSDKERELLRGMSDLGLTPNGGRRE
jgi:hypothetical protein